MGVLCASDGRAALPTWVQRLEAQGVVHMNYINHEAVPETVDVEGDFFAGETLQHRNLHAESCEPISFPGNRCSTVGVTVDASVYFQHQVKSAPNIGFRV